MLAAGGAVLAQDDADTMDEMKSMDAKQTEDVRKRLNGLTNYGAFDWIVFWTDDDLVYLSGKVVEPSLKKAAEAAVKKVEGVKTVENEIQVLPVSPADDRIRIAAYAAIYGHSAMTRYVPGGGTNFVAPSPRFRDATNLVQTGQFHEGPHAIHIIVEHGNLTLLGIVDSRLHSQIAEVQAKSINGVFSVTNSLRIE
ncbi:MAG TPA: BON domain-containing protein [Acidobacteriota bacterium]|nr:BON domain-containing protein [Acidobacteriota bacterium]